jgi:hypothetical protein
MHLQANASFLENMRHTSENLMYNTYLQIIFNDNYIIPFQGGGISSKKLAENTCF